ncbi:MAG: hypothetical protein V4619_00175 [Bacteroidota bacterium]
MLAKLPFKKNQVFFAGILLLIVICYKLAFKNTIDAWQTNRKLKAQTKTGNLAYQPDYLNRKARNLDKVIDSYRADTSTFRSNFINRVALMAAKENVKLSDVPSPNSSTRSDRLIIQKISLEGDYFSLIRTVQGIQQTQGIGFVRSVRFKVANSPSNVNQKLIVEIFLEIAR